MSDRGRLDDEAARRERIVRALRGACLAGDVDAVAGLLAADASAVVELADGDRVLLRGRDQVAIRLVSALGAVRDVAVRQVNSQPGLVLHGGDGATGGGVGGDGVVGVVSARIAGAFIAECWVLLNPARLGHFGR